MDLGRDEASAFGPASFAEGGLLPYEGRTLMGDAAGLRTAALNAEQDGWLAPNNPVLVRGSARILPLAWRGDPKSGSNSGVDLEEIAEFASQMQSSGVYWAGGWTTLDDLREHRGDSIGSYVAALLAAGATRVNFWTYSETIGLALAWAGNEDEGTMSLAFHVVPASWVSERFVSKAVRGIDVRWSWSEVIDLYAARIDAEQAGAADNLTEADQEEQRS